MAREAPPVSVQCEQADKDIFLRAAEIFGTMPEVMSIAAAYIDGMITGKRTKAEELEAARAAARAAATSVRQVSNGSADRSKVSAGS